MKTMLQVTYLGGNLPDKAEAACLERAAEYARERGYQIVEIAERPVSCGLWVPYASYIEKHSDLKRLVDKCDFPDDRRAQLTSDLVRFHFAAHASDPVLYVDRDAYPIADVGPGVSFSEYGIHAIDHCLFHSDNPEFFRVLLEGIESKLEDHGGRLQVYWPVIHALVNDLCLGKVGVLDLGSFHHIGKSRAET